MQVPVSVFEAALFIVNIWCVDFFSSFRPLKHSYFEINQENFRIKNLQPLDKLTTKFSILNSLKMTECSEAKSAKQSFASKKQNLRYFDAKLQAIFSDFKTGNICN